MENEQEIPVEDKAKPVPAAGAGAETEALDNLQADVDFENMAPPSFADRLGLLAAKMKCRSEIIVSGKPQENDLPGSSIFRTYGDGSQAVANVDAKSGKVTAKVTVAADGTITTSSANGAPFQIRQEGDRQYVTMPSGDTVVVQGNRVIKTNTGGKTTEMLTPEEGQAREQQRIEQQREQQEQKLQSVSGSIINGLERGQIPVEEIRKAYEDAREGLFGKNGIAALTKRLNTTGDDGFKRQFEFQATENPKTGQIDVSLRHLITGVSTHIPVPYYIPIPKLFGVKGH